MSMAVNSAATHGGGKIGRAQRIKPELLKPNRDVGAQVFIADAPSETQQWHDARAPCRASGNASRWRAE
jgi:cobyric acid synthase